MNCHFINKNKTSFTTSFKKADHLRAGSGLEVSKRGEAGMGRGRRNWLVRVDLGEAGGRAGKGGWRQARREMAEAWTGGQLPSQAGRAGVSWGPGAG